MNKPYFENVKSIGKLYLDYVFYKFENEPILFTCRDDVKNLYFCLCSEIRYEQKWIIVKSDLHTLRALVNEKIEIVSVFLGSEDVIVIRSDLQGNESSTVVDVKQVDRLDLPQDGTYLRCDKGKAQRYLQEKAVEILPLGIKIKMDISTSLNEKVGAYEFSFNKSVEVLKNELETYAEFGKKECTEWFLEMSEKAKGLEPFIHDYAIEAEERYVKQTDTMRIDEPETDHYLDAA